MTVPGLSLSASTFPAILVSPDSAAPFFGFLPAFCHCTELDPCLSQQHSSTSLPKLILLWFSAVAAAQQQMLFMSLPLA